jgi:hypothetical protein
LSVRGKSWEIVILRERCEDIDIPAFLLHIVPLGNQCREASTS